VILADFPPSLLRAFAILFGLAWGSFLNVVIYRVPRGMSVVHPPSACPTCGTMIPGYRNVPVLTYLFQLGRTACCKTKLSPRYPLVEAIGGLLAWAIVEQLVLTLPGDTSMLQVSGLFLACFGLALALVAAAFIDLEHMYIPDWVSIGGTVLGIATFSLRGTTTLVESLLGAAIGFLMVWLPFSVGYKALRGQTGMGMGDAKLVMLAGAWFGWKGAVFVLLAGAVQGTIAAIVLLLTKGKIEEPEAVRAEKEAMMRELEAMSPEERAKAEEELANDPIYEELSGGVGQARIAFGPFLVLATLEYLLLGDTLIDELFRWLTVPPI